MSRLEARRGIRARERLRIQRGLVVGLLLATVGLVAAAVMEPVRAPGDQPVAAGRGVLGAAPQTPHWPVEGPGTWRYADSEGPVLGVGGEVVRFRVAVEEGLSVEPPDFADEVEAILGAERGWTAGGEVRFQRVPRQAQFDFTVFLATPATSEGMCATGGVHTGGETSCRLQAQVIVNVAGWLAGAPGYTAPLADYRAYLLNHLVGRELGYGLEGCPRAGQPAPVMLPQAMGLRGCQPNPWPYRGTTRYAGPEIP